jgi:serine/threonine-protein kinase RsbW
VVTSGYRLSAVAELASLELLHELVARLRAEHPAVASIDLSLLETAMVELLNNVIEHGCRAGAEPAEFTVEIEVDADRLEAHLFDSGAAGPDPAGRPMPEVWAENGRGLALAEAVVDELTYERDDLGQNVWTLVRRRSA